MGLYNDFINQTRKPEGFLGKMMVNGMNSGHAKMADWGISHLTSISPKEIVELGCGGGRNADALLKRFIDANVTAKTILRCRLQRLQRIIRIISKQADVK